MTALEIHPSAEELASFTLGRLNEGALAAIETHLATCTDCQERAAAVPGDSLVELLRSTHTSLGAVSSQAPTEPQLTVATNTVSIVPAATATEADGTVELSAPPLELAHHERYRIVRLLGAGGMGSVYEAEHRVMQRPVALKVINPAFTSCSATLERFRREVRAAARLAHPNIVTTYDAEDAGKTLFLVMEFVEGTSLGKLVKEQGPLPMAVACDYARQAALGLQHAHERGMVHRDVKPDNLILMKNTAPAVVKVLDFGLAVLTAERADSGLTNTNVVMGTPDYMAPEQAEDARKADIRADVYSLGCTLYYLLTGSVPFPAATMMQKILAHREKSIPPLSKARPDLPPRLAALVSKMLAKQPAQRYQTPGEVAAALAPFTAETKSPPAKNRSTRGWLVGAAMLLFGLILAAGVVVYRIQTDEGEIVITADSPDVEVRVKQGGKLIDIIDTKTNRKLRLHSGVYELELMDGDGLKLNIHKADLTRNRIVLAKIERLPRATPPAAVAPPVAVAPVAIAPPAAVAFAAPAPVISEIQLLHQVRLSRPEDHYFHFSVSRDGQLFAADVGKKWKQTQVVVWDGKTGKERWRVDGGMGQFTPDGTRILVTNKIPQDATCRVYEAATGKPLRSLRFGEPLESFLALADNRHAVFYNRRHDADLCDLETGEIRQSWRFATWDDTFIGLSRCTDDGRVFFIRPRTSTKIIAWDVQKNGRTNEFDHVMQYQKYQEFLILPGNKQAMVAPAEGGGYGILDLADGKVTPFPKERSYPPYVVGGNNSSDARLVLCGDANGKLFSPDCLTGRVTATLQLPDGARLTRDDRIQMSPEGGYACVLTANTLYFLRLVQTPAAEVKKEPKKVGEVSIFEGHSSVVRRVFFANEGRHALSAGFDRILILWDVATGKEVRRFEGHTNWIDSAAVSRDSRLAISGGLDNTVRVWEVATGKELRQFKGNPGRVVSLAISNDGKRALTGSWDRTMRFFDMETGNELRRFNGHVNVVQAVAFSPDGLHALSGSWDKGRTRTLKMFEVDTGRDLGLLFDGYAEGIQDATVSPDGMLALSGGPDKAVRLWDAATGKALRSFEGHKNMIKSVAFAPDGRRALSGGDDRTVRLWDVATGEPLHCFVGHTALVTSVAFSPDGRYALSGSDDQTMRLWRLPEPAPTNKTLNP